MEESKYEILLRNTLNPLGLAWSKVFGDTGEGSKSVAALAGELDWYPYAVHVNSNRVHTVLWVLIYPRRSRPAGEMSRDGEFLTHISARVVSGRVSTAVVVAGMRNDQRIK